MSDETYRGRWIDEVFRTPVVSAEVKVFLLFLAFRHMSPEGRVSESRVQLAQALNCHQRRISARFETAIEAKFMERVSRGQKGRTAVYQATLPSVQGADNQHPEARQGAGNQHPEPKSQGAKNAHPEARQGAGNQHPESRTQGAGSPPAESGPLYKDRAQAHTRAHFTADPHRHDTTTDHGEDAVVVALFDEKNTTGKAHTPARKRASESAVVDEFAAFWDAYPRKVAKGAARKAWVKAIKDGADPDDIVGGARRYAADPRRADSDIRYTAHPATWLNAERWADEETPLAACRPPSPLDRRQQTTNDIFGRAMQRAEHREENGR